MGRFYSEEEIATALELYADLGPAETSRRLKIPRGVLKVWATKGHVPWTPNIDEEATEIVGDDTVTDVATRPRMSVAEITSRTEKARAFHAAYQKQLRDDLRTRLLEKAHDALDRMEQIHIEFKGKDAAQVEYPTAPAEAFRAYSQAAGTLLREYRTEMGEVGKREETVTTVKDAISSDHERGALRGAIERELEQREREAATSSSD